MKVILIAKRNLDIYSENNSQAREALSLWIMNVQNADRDTPHSIKHTFNSADILGNGTDRVVFNIRGKQYTINDY